jgi:apolipoprotein N-acyltransferase
MPRLIAMPASFVLFEWVRGWLFTGFPWITLGTSQVPASPLAGFAPIVGNYGVSLVVAAAAALLVALVLSAPWSRSRYVLLAALAGIFVAGGLARWPEWTEADGAPVTVALLQGNIPQELKWRDEVRAQTLAQYRRMIVEAETRIVVLPETALPAFLDTLPPAYLEELREHARRTGKEILLGTVERQPDRAGVEYYNSVVVLGPRPLESYRKRHLVPFGEFIPNGFHWVLAILRIPLSDFARGGDQQPPLQAGGTRFAVAICYEDLFGEEIIAALPAAQALLNVSNDAWFGDSLQLDQHLQASQMRALETGRWMVRATNTGVTAAIDPQGRVAARLPVYTKATLRTTIEPRRGSTPYIRWGNSLALALIAAGLLAAAWKGRRPESA